MDDQVICLYVKAEKQANKTRFGGAAVEAEAWGSNYVNKGPVPAVSTSEGEERAILRDNMPFGSPANKTFGTYFIGYCRELWVIEKMLKRMYCGVPDGLHDRTLDYSIPQIGSVFFAPSLDVLDSLGDE